jgi:hypothetical protein
VRSYRLQQLTNEASAGPVAPKPFQLMVVAALLAGVLGLGAAYLEGAARSRRSGATADALTEVESLAGDGADDPAPEMSRIPRSDAEARERLRDVETSWRR